MTPKTEYGVFADLNRPLVKHERDAIFEALEANVPNSGYVGLQKGPNDEVYFAVDAPSAVEADAQAKRYMEIVLREAKVAVEYAIQLQKL
jgi:hypothetical protein